MREPAPVVSRGGRRAFLVDVADGELRQGRYVMGALYA